ncbi:hypothetical protein EV426DRAFT_575679 [Tirmania nivea]|nr:hypothetical protein EV426DRAFT_575679 [Tirmania nivea]
MAQYEVLRAVFDRDIEERAGEMQRQDQGEAEVKEFTDVMSGFKWFGPHETPCTIVRYFDYSNDAIAFFKRYLSIPCYFDEASAEGIQRRVSKIPLNYPLCDMSTELLFYCIDFLVNQVSGGDVHLYRCFDDLWFWGRDKKKRELVWQEMQNYSDIPRLET